MRKARLPLQSYSSRSKDKKELRRRFSIASANALSKGYKWTISFHIWLNLIELPCYYCGQLRKNDKSKYGSRLDRIDNDEGYHFANVLPCCTSCNRSRGDRYDVEEFKVMIAALIDYRKNKKASVSTGLI